MMHKRFRVQIIVRAAALIVITAALTVLVGWTQQYALAAVLVAVLAYVVVSLIRYVEKTARDLTRFLESVRYADFSQGFTSEGRGPLFDRLQDAFEDVTSAFRRIRAEEEQVRYLENVVQHLGMALISYRDDGPLS